jgi:peroxiredoxin
MLKNGELFPTLSFPCAGGGEIRLPTDLAGAFAVILFYRGFWSSACNDQLYAFAKSADAFAQENIKVVAVSVDDRKSTEALVERVKLGFPVAYAADARAVSSVTGAIVNEDAVFLEATGFVLNPEGRVEAAVYTSDENSEDRIVTIAYASGMVGRLMPEDVLRFVRGLKLSA